MTANKLGLATPIDFIIFEEEEIIFMEVKTGNSQLNANQRRVKKQVEEKKFAGRRLG